MAPSVESSTRSQKKTNAILQACHKGDRKKLQQAIKALKGDEMEKIEMEEQLIHICAQSGSVDCLKLIIKTFGLDLIELSALNSAGQTPLHMAVIADNSPRMVDYLIELGVDVNLPDSKGHSPLYCAVANSNLKVVSLLLKSGADASQTDVFGASAIHYATQMCSEDNSNATKILSQLLVSTDSAGLNQQDCDGRTPLVWAGSVGSPTAVKLLIEAKVDAMIPDNDGLTALHCSSSNGYKEVIEMLASYNPELIHAKDKHGCTPLFYAATHNYLSALHTLLNHDAEPNHQDKMGRSVAHCAAERGNIDVLNELERRGANVWLRSDKGDYPLDEAVKSSKSDAALHLLGVSYTDMTDLNQFGEEPNRTTLHLVCKTGNLFVLQKLLENSQTDVNCVMTNTAGKKMTPLDVCEDNGHSSCAELIQSYGGQRFQPESSQTSELVKPQPTSPRESDKPAAKGRTTPSVRQKSAKLSQGSSTSKSSEERKKGQGQSETQATKQTKILKKTGAVKQQNSRSKSGRQLANRAQTEQGNNSTAINCNTNRAPSKRGESIDSVTELELGNRSRSIVAAYSAGDLYNKSHHTVDRGTKASEIPSCQLARPPHSLYSQSQLPYSNSCSLPYVDVSVHIHYPKNKKVGGSRRAKSAASSRRHQITESVNHFEAIRQSARSLRDQYLKTRQRTAQYQPSNRASTTPSISSTDGDKVNPEYRVIATRGGFTKIRITPAMASAKQQQAINKIKHSSGNVAFTQGYDGRLRPRLGLNIHVPPKLKS